MSKKYLSILIVSKALILLLCGHAFAAGFALTQHGARAMGMANAFTGIANDPTTLFFNPAGMAQLEGLQLAASMTMITPAITYTGDIPGTTTEAEVNSNRQYFWVPSVHAAYRLHERVSLGFSFNVPYGLGVDWPREVTLNGTTMGWWGRNAVEKINLQTYYFTPTVGLQIHPRLLLGAGFSIARGTVSMTRALTINNSIADDIEVKLAGTDTSFGATAGLLIKAIPELLDVGLTYRSGTKFTFKGQAAFTQNGSADNIPSALRQQLQDGDAEAPMNTPHVISFGLGFFPTKEFTVGATFDVYTWSDYEKLEIIFPDHSAQNSTDIKDWKNSITLSLGGEYLINKKFAARLGIIFDQSPVPETTVGPELPDGERYEFAAGFGYYQGDLHLDLGYQFITSGEVKPDEVAPVIGKYVTRAHLVGLSLNYMLGI